MFLVGIDFKMFDLARSFVGDGLFGQIHFHFHLRIGRDRVEQLFQNSVTTTGSTKLFSSLFLCISAKKLDTTTRKP